MSIVYKSYFGGGIATCLKTITKNLNVRDFSEL
jgi:hypothetical protein